MDPLHNIILSLSPNEKRYFRIFSATFKNSSQVIKLFEKLSKIGIYRISVHSRVSSGLSEIINKKLVVTEKRSIDQKKYNEGIQPTDYIEAEDQNAYF